MHCKWLMALLHFLRVWLWCQWNPPQRVQCHNRSVLVQRACDGTHLWTLPGETYTHTDKKCWYKEMGCVHFHENCSVAHEKKEKEKKEVDLILQGQMYTQFYTSSFHSINLWGQVSGPSDSYDVEILNIGHYVKLPFLGNWLLLNMIHTCRRLSTSADVEADTSTFRVAWEFCVVIHSEKLEACQLQSLGSMHTATSPWSTKQQI